MPAELKLGALTFVGLVGGAHVHVTVLGDGIHGQRPLCGNVVVTPDEWESLVRASMVVEAANVVGRHWIDQAGVNAAYLDELARRTHGE